jgi:hypothetical protein
VHPAARHAERQGAHHEYIPPTTPGVIDRSLSSQQSNVPTMASDIERGSSTHYGNVPSTTSDVNRSPSTQHGNAPTTSPGVDGGSYTINNTQGAQPSGTPISEALLNAPMPNVKKRKSLSTFGRETGKKIKEKFSTLGRKKHPPEQPVPEPEIAVHEEVYNTTSGTGRFQMWPFGRKKKVDLTTYF